MDRLWDILEGLYGTYGSRQDGQETASVRSSRPTSRASSAPASEDEGGSSSTPKRARVTTAEEAIASAELSLGNVQPLDPPQLVSELPAPGAVYPNSSDVLMFCGIPDHMKPTKHPIPGKLPLYACQVCPNKLITNQASVCNHIRRAHLNLVFGCLYCEYTCLSSDYWSRHMSKEHADQERFCDQAQMASIVSHLARGIKQEFMAKVATETKEKTETEEKVTPPQPMEQGVVVPKADSDIEEIIDPGQ